MRRRVVFLTGSIAALIVVAFLVPLSITVDRLASEQATSEAERAVQVLAQNLSVSGIADRQVVSALVDNVNAGSPDTELIVTFLDGTTIGEAAVSSGSLDQAFSGSSATLTVPVGVEVVAPIVRAEGVVAVVAGVVDNDSLSRNVLAANLLLGVLGLALIAIAMLLADRLGRSIVRPVAELSEAARLVADGDFSVRVTPGGPPELVEVGTAFNRLIERIGVLLSDERSSVADLAHRLRTPLTALRLSAESDEQSERLTADLDALERTVNHVISEARRPVREGAGAVTDLAALVRDRSEFWGVLADEQNRRWEVSVEAEPHVILGHRADVGAAVDALIGNVLAHTPDGTGYQIRVRAGAQGMSELVVTDEGTGFEFEPEAGISSSESTGIGIDIVRRTAQAHGGWVDIGTSGNGGARVVVAFATAG